MVLLFTIASVAQNSITYKNEIINALDQNVNKVGLWKLYNDAENVLITVDFNKAKTSFYKDSKLIATYSKANHLEIYKDSKTINATYAYKADNSQTLLTESGKELDTETVKYYAQASEVYPIFYGGMSELYAFIGNNFQSNGQKGMVKVKFVIDKNGYTKDIEVVTSTNVLLDEEAKRIVSIFPRWQPGFQGGDFVNVSYIVPFNIQ